MKNQYIQYVQSKLNNNLDLLFRTIEIELGLIYIICIETICDEILISKGIIEPILKNKNAKSIDMIKKEIVTMSNIDDVLDLEDATDLLVEGKVIIAFSFNDKRALYCDVKKYAFRAIGMPPTEAVLKGPREGFTENLMVNISLIRKWLKDENLKCESIDVGKKSKMNVVLVYIENVAPTKLVDHIRTEINKMDKGFILQANHITEQLQTKRTAFDTISYTEKPDVLVTKISEGKVGILIEGDPSAISAPCFFVEKFQAPTDYSMVKYMGNFIRIIRWMAFVVAIMLPGLYIALTTHHFSLIPRMLAYRLALTRAGVPYPIFIELMLLTGFFQILREGGVRLPQPIGQAISIVGALILGDAAVASGLASDITVLIVALSSISSFLIPAFSEAIVMWSIVLVIFSTILGLPGFFIGFAVLTGHLAGLTSCGYPYLYPLGTLKSFKFKDTFVRSDLNKISNNMFDEDKKR